MTFEPDSFQTIESVEIDKIGAAETGNNRKQPPIWSQATGETKKTK